jgi:hypothetical protein
MRIDYIHQVHAGIKTFADLFEHLGPTIVWGADFDCDFGRDGHVSRRVGALGDSRITVKGNVGATNRVRVSLRNQPRVVREKMSEVVLLDVVAQEDRHATAERCVAEIWNVHGDNSSTHKLRRATIVREP